MTALKGCHRPPYDAPGGLALPEPAVPSNRPLYSLHNRWGSEADHGQHSRMPTGWASYPAESGQVSGPADLLWVVLDNLDNVTRLK